MNMLFKIEDVVKEAKVKIEEVTGAKFETPVNRDKKKVNPNHFYFLCNDDLNIEIALYFKENLGVANSDFVICGIQKPFSKKEEFDFRSIHGGNKCLDYIVNSVKEIIEKNK